MNDAKWTTLIMIIDLWDNDRRSSIKSAIIKAFILQEHLLVHEEEIHDRCAEIGDKLIFNLKFKYVNSRDLDELPKTIYEKFNCDIYCMISDDAGRRDAVYYCLEDEKKEYGIEHEGRDEDPSEQVSA